ncbi:DUF5082 domain-containing protein [Pseudalkalibacillus decolorationis]|uniref:DUF5082 domain-containing protein n=1 Tax=Pseudalkalibacillus decolorationis TaxID=163879 RepID=UPI002147DBDB|nr:DUF5082 domain-containing protein [Pseudalkalibacillus decolorationis]
MGFFDELNDLKNVISSRSSDVQEKIDRLRQAKSDIRNEQSYLLGEINQIQRPELARSWMGTRSGDFENDRGEAFKTMMRIGNDRYEDYERIIEMQINSLEMQKGFIDGAFALANEADQLLSKGEEAFDDIQAKIDSINWRLF